MQRGQRVLNDLLKNRTLCRRSSLPPRDGGWERGWARSHSLVEGLDKQVHFITCTAVKNARFELFNYFVILTADITCVPE
jgi:hypothetical protein